MIKLNRSQRGFGEYFVNAHKIQAVFLESEKTWIQLTVGGFYVEESVEYVVQQINKVLIGGSK